MRIGSIRLSTVFLCLLVPWLAGFNNPLSQGLRPLTSTPVTPTAGDDSVEENAVTPSSLQDKDSAVPPRRKIRYKRRKLRVPRYRARPQIMTSPLKAHVTKPKTISGIHYDDVVALMHAIKKEEFNDAYRLAKKINEPVLTSYVLWNGYRLYWLKHPLEKLEAFIDKHRNWPDIDRVMIAAEHALDLKNNDANDVLAWFSRYPPMSNLGHLKRLNALGKTGKKQAEIAYARKIWREYDLMPQHKDYFLRTYANALTDEDYLARLQRLLAVGGVQDVKNKISQMRPRLRAQLYRQWRSELPPFVIGQLIKQLPSKVVAKHPLSAALVQFQKTRDFEESFDALQALPHAANNHHAWWQAYEDYIRFLLYDGYVEEAYTLAKQHRQVWKEGFSEGEWLSGWIALSFLNDSLSAYRHFAHLFDEVHSSLEKSRAAYWTWRAAHVMGERDLARTWLEKGALYPTTLYGQLCRAQLSWSYKDIFVPTPQVSPFDHESLDEDLQALNHDGLLTLLGFFATTDTVEQGMPFFRHMLFQRSTNDRQRAYIINMLAQFGHSEYAVYLSRKLVEQGYPEPRGAYPMISDEHLPALGVEKALVLSVIRQESNFMAVEAVSHAGALGWMQVMPATAESVTKDLNIPYSQTRLLHDYTYNVTIGSSYLTGLAARYANSYPMILAAYNAGPSRVWAWTRKFGDPRRDNVNKIDWIEAIPFYETRHYVLKVLSNLQVYRRLLAKSDKSLRRMNTFGAP